VKRSVPDEGIEKRESQSSKRAKLDERSTSHQNTRTPSLTKVRSIEREEDTSIRGESNQTTPSDEESAIRSQETGKGCSHKEVKRRKRRSTSLDRSDSPLFPSIRKKSKVVEKDKEAKSRQRSSTSKRESKDGSRELSPIGRACLTLSNEKSVLDYGYLVTNRCSSHHNSERSTLEESLILSQKVKKEIFFFFIFLSGDLENYFSSLGEIVHCYIPYNTFTGKQKPFGFVIFRSQKTAFKAYEQHVHWIRGYKFIAKLAVLEGQEHVNKILVSGLPVLFDEGDEEFFPLNLLFSLEELFYHFSKRGTLVDYVICKDERGVSKGFGFVQFVKGESVAKALAQSHIIGNSKLQVRVVQWEDLMQFEQRKRETKNMISPSQDKSKMIEMESSAIKSSPTSSLLRSKRLPQTQEIVVDPR